MTSPRFQKAWLKATNFPKPSLHKPLGLTELTQRVDCPELAAEVYLASLLAVDGSRLEAELYLDALAFRLGVPQALVAQMHQQVLEPPQAVA